MVSCARATRGLRRPSLDRAVGAHLARPQGQREDRKAVVALGAQWEQSRPSPKGGGRKMEERDRRCFNRVQEPLEESLRPTMFLPGESE